MTLLFDTGFRTLYEGMRTERAERLSWIPKHLPFGVGFLDAAMGAILPHDLVLVGAKTGTGKTELATLIADHTIRRGKRVHYFALEGEAHELERRIKYRRLIERAHRRGMRYLDWHLGRYDATNAALEREIEDEDVAIRKNLHVFYRSRGDFTADDFESRVLSIQSETDLVILDHLHYVDSTDSDQNRGYRNVVKQIRDLSLGLGKPVVVVAHVRKAALRGGALVPDLDDFHGTSDIPKIATKAIMLSRANDQPPSLPWMWPTYIAIPKCRLDGSLSSYVALVEYNAKKGRYEDGFVLGMLNPDGTKWTAIHEEKRIPDWAKPQPTEGA